MARAPSKIMTATEKKVAETNLKTALKSLNVAYKDVSATLHAAQRTHAAVIDDWSRQEKALNARISGDLKSFGKSKNTALTLANKTLDAAEKTHTKMTSASDKGRMKLNAQIAAVAEAPVEAARRGRPPAVTAAAPIIHTPKAAVPIATPAGEGIAVAKRRGRPPMVKLAAAGAAAQA